MTAAACTCQWDDKEEHLILRDPNCGVHSPKVVTTFTSGAVRGSDEIRYDLLPKELLIRAISAFVEGEVKYGKGNYKKGIPVQNLLNHAINHLLDYQDYLNSIELSAEVPGKVLVDKPVLKEDHIAHALANLGMLCWMEAHNDSQRST